MAVAAFIALPSFAGFILTTLMTEPRFLIWAATIVSLLVGYCLYTFGFMIQQNIDKKVLTNVLMKEP